MGDENHIFEIASDHNQTSVSFKSSNITFDAKDCILIIMHDVTMQ